MKRSAIGGLILVIIGGCSDSNPEIALTMCSPDQRAEISDTVPKATPSARDATKVETMRNVSETVRQMSWQLCNARTNKWIDDDYFRRELTALREGAFNAYGGKAETTAATPTEEDMSICLNAAGDDQAKRDACAS